MDTYEKWFDKMEAEKEQAETDETKKKLNNKEETSLSDIISEEIKLPDKIKVKQGLSDNAEDQEKRIVGNEAKEKLSKKKEGQTGHLQKYKTKLGHLIKSRSRKEPPANVRPEEKLNDQIKVFKISNDISTVKIIPDIWTKDIQLESHALVVDNNLGENGIKDEMLTMIKTSGIDYIIAPGFEDGFYEKASDAGLQLIECREIGLIGEGSNIKVYRDEGVIFDIDNGQEFKYKLVTDSARKNILQKVSLGECLIIGDDLTIKFLDIEKDKIKICINASKVVTVYQHKYVMIGGEIRIKITNIISDQISLVIKAPEGIAINRQ